MGNSVTRRSIPLDDHGYLWEHTIDGELLFGLMQNRYDTNVSPLPLPQPPKIYYQGAPNMDPMVVQHIQEVLFLAGFDPVLIDGIYGPLTAAAVGAFQTSNGLLIDGKVGPQTAKALGIDLSGSQLTIDGVTQGA